MLSVTTRTKFGPKNSERDIFNLRMNLISDTQYSVGEPHTSDLASSCNSSINSSSNNNNTTTTPAQTWNLSKIVFLFFLFRRQFFLPVWILYFQSTKSFFSIFFHSAVFHFERVFTSDFQTLELYLFMVSQTGQWGLKSWHFPGNKCLFHFNYQTLQSFSRWDMSWVH